MGSSVDAHIAFGWIMPEYACEWQPGHESCERITYGETDDDQGDYYWECKVEAEAEAESFYLPDHTELLDNGFDGSGYAGENSTIVYLKDTEVWANWAAMKFSLSPSIGPVQEHVMRADAERIGMKLPDEPAAWILWPHYG